ncbi:hypothetical protein BHM03_00058168 [Ensete ventricosum]|nr:hypothetical protein BHM03_00058168 [Ensete ventricosum]
MLGQSQVRASGRGLDDAVGTHQEITGSSPKVSGAYREFTGSSSKVIESLSGMHQGFTRRWPRLVGSSSEVTRKIAGSGEGHFAR